ncbi:hypothetical protein [Micromonospora sp. MA102]|uniref:hypothetical protein n=1 Tax=Micromonospora sp. MA102 TaxID=2952755 RepID=UPI0021C8B6C9|nr:hypothetical protein [Micromonospora sp. MA102]
MDCRRAGRIECCARSSGLRKQLDIGEGVPVLVVFRADGSRELYHADRIRVGR